MNDPRNTYLETQVFTATPQKLRLMLIEGAIRYASQTVDHWEQGRSEDGVAAILRCQAVIAELLGGVRDDGSPLTRQVSDIYTFISQVLQEAQLDSDPQRIADVILILREERETWQQLCLQLPEAPQPIAADIPQEGEILAPRRVDSTFSMGYIPQPMSLTSDSITSSGFSLEM